MTEFNDRRDASEYPERMADYWGKGMPAVFPRGTEPIGLLPFPGAGRRKDRKDYDQGLIDRVLSNPDAHRAVVDPRGLKSFGGQSHVQREGVEYYSGNQYARTGRTFADQDQPGNQHPFVYSRRSLIPGRPNDEILLSGRHRATAALLQGRQLEALRVEGDWGPER